MNRIAAVLSLIAVLALGLVAVGCGGDDDGPTTNAPPATEGINASDGDRNAIEDLVEKVRAYTKTSDAKGFCGLFEPSRLEETLGREKCIKIFTRGLKSTPKNQKYVIEGMNVDGDRATVTFGYGGNAYFEKIDGTWYAATPDVGGQLEPEDG
jgi:hypothetical protein